MPDHTIIAAMFGAEFRRCLIELDVDGIIALHKRTMIPGTEPKTRKQALATLHAARAMAESIPLHLRIYSDRWLRERGLGEFLPAHLSETKRIKEAGNERLKRG